MMEPANAVIRQVLRLDDFIALISSIANKAEHKQPNKSGDPFWWTL